MRALGRPQDMFSDKAIQLQPIFAQWIQNVHLLAPAVFGFGRCGHSAQGLPAAAARHLHRQQYPADF
jgi:hypothetical protein